MTAFTGTAMYVILWWVTLMAVLPVFSRPVAEADPISGWRGIPRRVPFLKILLTTTIVAALIWGAADLVISSSWISFRSGPWALPDN